MTSSIAKDKLDALKKEYEEMEKKLAQSEGIFDLEKHKEISQKYAELKEINDKRGLLEKIEKEINENAVLLENEDNDELKTLAQEEQERLLKQKTALEKEIRDLVSPDERAKYKNIIVEIRAGAGGGEAALFVSSLFRMYSRYAQKRGWSETLIDSADTSLGGFKEIIPVKEFIRICFLKAGCIACKESPILKNRGEFTPLPFRSPFCRKWKRMK